MATVKHIDDDITVCARCGSSDVERVDCGACGGEGYHDWEELQFEDPLWYQPGDTEVCHQCNGEGGWWACYACQRAAMAKEAATPPCL